jgi:phosphatidylethanolamine-binding protein (PEBP) family uncharacterized protein
MFFFTRKQRKQKKITRKRKIQKGGELSVYFQGKEAKGNVKPRNQTLVMPTISWTTIPDKLYTILIWDPDAPARSWVHFLAMNLRTPNLSTGDILLSYEPPTPPSGVHRYYTTVYMQKSIIDDMPVPKERGNFDVDEFVSKYGLMKVGEKMIRVRA